jgi:hypothetical protein
MIPPQNGFFSSKKNICLFDSPVYLSGLPTSYPENFLDYTLLLNAANIASADIASSVAVHPMSDPTKFKFFFFLLAGAKI